MEDTSIIGVAFPIPRFLEVIGIERSSSAAFSRHCKIHKSTYEDLFGVEYSTMYSPTSDKEVMSIKLTKFKNIGTNPNVDQDFEILRYFSKHHDQKSSYMRGISNNSIPVVRIEDGQLFGSITTASKLIGIEKAKILWCCNGDIPYCKKWSTKHTFRYARFK